MLNFIAGDLERGAYYPQTARPRNRAEMLAPSG
jgi:hypothetical protein